MPRRDGQRQEPEWADLHRVGGGTTRAAWRTREERYRKFLLEFSYHGNVSWACEEAGVSRGNVYALQERDKDFADDWKQAEELSRDTLRRVATLVGSIGWWNEKTDKDGNVIQREWRLSEKVLLKLLEARCPEFKPKLEFGGDALEFAKKLAEASCAIGASVPAPPAKNEERGA